MYIPQSQLKNLSKIFSPNKVMVIYGPRRVGKTTLLNQFLKTIKQKYLLVNGEDITIQKYLSSQSISQLRDFIGEHKLLAIDEAQKIKNIGLNLKLILDNIKGIKIIATGSSSFDLAGTLGEPLVGRKYTLKLFPLAQMEISQIENRAETEANLETRLIYGSYPEIVISKSNKARQRYLKEIVSSYLYKDILELNGVRHSDKIVRLLQLLAWQIGKEVSYTELGSQLNMSKNTVDRYLDLLEKVFVVYKLTGFSRNLRKEISKNPRYYFYDNGIRNTLINNFNTLSIRNDIGMLWENYIITERLKKQEYKHINVNNYFWRTYEQKEIDLVEERGGKLFGFEIKWGTKKVRAPGGWLDNYDQACFKEINQDNYLRFIS